MATGLVVMTPTSVNVSGGTASIRPDGGVDFSAATSLSLNGVFTSAYDDYMVVSRNVSSGADAIIGGRFRLSGTDASGTNYTAQAIFVNDTVVGAARALQSFFQAGRTASSLRSGVTYYLYGPALAQPTATRSVTVSALNSGVINDTACTHSISTAYDGLTVFPESGNFTGMITVYGYTQ